MASYDDLRARIEKADKARQDAEKQVAVCEDRLQDLREKAQEEFGTSDPDALFQIAEEAMQRAEEIAQELDALLSEAGF